MIDLENVEVQVWEDGGKFHINHFTKVWTEPDGSQRDKAEMKEEWMLMLNRIKSTFLGRKWDGDNKHWTAPINSHNQFLSDFYNYKNPYEPWDAPLTAQMFAEDRAKAIEKVPEKLIKAMDDRPYQWIMLSHLLRRKRCINAADMRMGKSLPYLVACIILGVTDSWFITTVSAKQGISQEVEKWGLDARLIPMTYHKFTKLITGDASIVPKILCFDEIHMIKDPKSQRGKAAHIARDTQAEKFGDDRYIWGLSGTPAPRDPADWWNVINSIAAGFLHQSNKLEFKKTLAYIEFMDNDTGGRYPVMDVTQGLNGWREDAVEQLGNKIKGMVEVFQNSKYIPKYKAPEREIIDIPVDRGTKAAIRLLKNTMRGKGAQLQNTLHQLSDGFQYKYTYNDEGNKVRDKTEIYNTFKDEYFIKQLKRFESVGRLVAYAKFTQSTDKICELAAQEDWEVLKMTGSGIKTINSLHDKDTLLKNMDATRDDKTIDKIIVICQADCGCTGLELSASPAVIYYSNTNKSANKWQSQGRIDSQNSIFYSKLWVELCYLEIDRLAIERLEMQKDLKELPESILIKAMEKDLEKEEVDNE